MTTDEFVKKIQALTESKDTKFVRLVSNVLRLAPEVEKVGSNTLKKYSAHEFNLFYMCRLDRVVSVIASYLFDNGFDGYSRAFVYGWARLLLDDAGGWDDSRDLSGQL